MSSATTVAAWFGAIGNALTFVLIMRRARR